MTRLDDFVADVAQSGLVPGPVLERARAEINGTVSTTPMSGSPTR